VQFSPVPSQIAIAVWVAGRRHFAFALNRMMLGNRLTKRYASDRNVRIEPCAPSNQPGTLTLYIPSCRDLLFEGLASIDPLGR
jgi:hypothetical protein